MLAIGPSLFVVYSPPATIRIWPKAPNALRGRGLRPASPVVQDDDLGALAASFNRRCGLVERQRLQAAFGTYVDPALPRLLEQGDEVFRGESAARGR